MCGAGITLGSNLSLSTLLQVGHHVQQLLIRTNSEPGLGEHDTGARDAVYAGNMVISDSSAIQSLLVAMPATGSGSQLAVSRNQGLHASGVTGIMSPWVPLVVVTLELVLCCEDSDSHY